MKLLTLLHDADFLSLHIVQQALGDENPHGFRADIGD